MRPKCASAVEMDPLDEIGKNAWKNVIQQAHKITMSAGSGSEYSTSVSADWAVCRSTFRHFSMKRKRTRKVRGKTENRRSDRSFAARSKQSQSADAGGPVIRNHCRAHRCTWSRSENPDQLGSELMREKLKLRIRSMSTCGEGKRGKQKCTAGLAASRYIGQISGRFFFNLQ